MDININAAAAARLRKLAISDVIDVRVREACQIGVQALARKEEVVGWLPIGPDTPSHDRLLLYSPPIPDKYIPAAVRVGTLDDARYSRLATHWAAIPPDPEPGK